MNGDHHDEQPVARAKSAMQVLRVLNAVAEHHEGLTFTELVQLIQLPKGSLHNGLQVLLSMGYVRQDESTRRFVPAPHLLELGMGYLRSTGFPEAAFPVLREAGEICPETISLGLLSEDAVVIVHTTPSRHTVGINIPVGSRWPLHCSAQGLAMLAHIPESEMVSLLPGQLPRFTSRSPRSRADVVDRLDDIRREGVAYVRGEMMEDHRSVGSAILGAERRAVGAVSIAAPASRADEAYMRRMGRMVATIATAINRRLGHLADDGTATLTLEDAWGVEVEKEKG